jgi:ClpP class serine protease
MCHFDYSELLADAGIKPTFIFAGDHKVDGNPYEPLPEAVRADYQREIDAFYELFLETVAAGRGDRLTSARAKATEARVLMGVDAVKAGLADDVATLDETISALANGSLLRSGSASSPAGSRAAKAVASPAAASASAAAARLGFAEPSFAPTSPRNIAGAAPAHASGIVAAAQAEADRQRARMERRR